MPGEQSLPSTLRRSEPKARRTWVKAHDSALKTYGEGRRAQQTAIAAVKHSYEKVGDHWEPKPSRGPSDARAARSPRPGGRGGSKGSAQGVNAKASRDHLYQVARTLDIPGRSSMTKPELVSAIERANRRQTARARS